MTPTVATDLGEDGVEGASRPGGREGYERFWVAEHHAVPGVASGSPPAGSPATVRRTLERLVERSAPDELMASTSTYDREALFASDAALRELVGAPSALPTAIR